MQYKNHSEGKENRPICLAIGKYGIDNFSFEIIDEVKTQGEADEKERYYIEYYHCLTSEYGYNITKGGKGMTVVVQKYIKLIGLRLKKK